MCATHFDIRLGFFLQLVGVILAILLEILACGPAAPNGSSGQQSTVLICLTCGFETIVVHRIAGFTV